MLEEATEDEADKIDKFGKKPRKKHSTREGSAEEMNGGRESVVCALLCLQSVYVCGRRVLGLSLKLSIHTKTRDVYQTRRTGYN